jgi:hypothetical protein
MKSRVDHFFSAYLGQLFAVGVVFCTCLGEGRGKRHLAPTPFYVSCFFLGGLKRGGGRVFWQVTIE